MIKVDKHTEALSLDTFRNMDYQATRQYDLPIELMMENAGYHLAQLAAKNLGATNRNIVIGVGNGNNGGGGLVAARRLAAWGYAVSIETFTDIDKPLPLSQLQRAKKFGVRTEPVMKADLYIDAFLGFSQRPPLPDQLIDKISKANNSMALKISLDIPTGLNIGDENSVFNADIIMTIAAMKKVLLPYVKSTTIYIADIGIPRELYDRYGIAQPAFYKCQNEI